MTDVLITVDTELSAGRQARGMDPRANFESSILGRCAAGDFGITWQMDRLDAYGLKGVFFVDPLPVLVHGEALLAEIVTPIMARGHEVQLHIHTEWLEWAKNSPVDGRQGRNLGNFPLADQITLLNLGNTLLTRAGAPPPTAFRAGNFGANDDSLAALAALGMQWDSSVNPAYLGQGCDISLLPEQSAAIRKNGVIELPVAGFYDRPGHFRPAQICAISSTEMKAALTHAADRRLPAFVIVTHSFEMLARDRRRPNRAVMARFEAMCRTIAERPDLRATGFADLDAEELLRAPQHQDRLAPSYLRTARRMIEQLFATWRYERRLTPA